MKKIIYTLIVVVVVSIGIFLSQDNSNEQINSSTITTSGISQIGEHLFLGRLLKNTDQGFEVSVIRNILGSIDGPVQLLKGDCGVIYPNSTYGIKVAKYSDNTFRCISATPSVND